MGNERCKYAGEQTQNPRREIRTGHTDYWAAARRQKCKRENGD
jgi:hypothetical protein